MAFARSARALVSLSFLVASSSAFVLPATRATASSPRIATAPILQIEPIQELPSKQLLKAIARCGSSATAADVAAAAGLEISEARRQVKKNMRRQSKQFLCADSSPLVVRVHSSSCWRGSSAPSCKCRTTASCSSSSRSPARSRAACVPPRCASASRTRGLPPLRPSTGSHARALASAFSPRSLWSRPRLQCSRRPKTQTATAARPAARSARYGARAPSTFYTTARGRTDIMDTSRPARRAFSNRASAFYSATATRISTSTSA